MGCTGLYCVGERITNAKEQTVARTQFCYHNSFNPILFFNWPKLHMIGCLEMYPTKKRKKSHIGRFSLLHTSIVAIRHFQFCFWYTKISIIEEIFSLPQSQPSTTIILTAFSSCIAFFRPMSLHRQCCRPACQGYELQSIHTT